MANWMIKENDPARLEIVERAKRLGITGTPDQAAHALGKIEVTLDSGETKQVNAHVVHAVDPIIEDGKEIVLINRTNPPGEGKPALPGGFIDPAQGGGVESAIRAAAREALEEAGIALDETNATLIGRRKMDRPEDVRVAQADMPKYGIKKDDVFMVSTQAVRFHVPDLAKTRLRAGDDAVPGSARRVAIESLSPDSMGIRDHYDMIAEALPEHRSNQNRTWTESLGERTGRHIG